MTVQSLLRLGIKSIAIAALPVSIWGAEVSEKPSVITPFEQLDTRCVNEWWDREDSPIVKIRVSHDEAVAFGRYTLSNGVVRLTA